MVMTRSISYPILGILLALLSHSCSAQNCSNTLINKAVYQGTPASFDLVNDNGAVQWQVIPTSISAEPLNITDTTGTILDPFTTTYAVNQSQLTIFNATVAAEGSMLYSTAGLYILNYESPSCDTAAGLIVIKNGPVCTWNPNTLLCQVEYAISDYLKINPIINWKDKSGVTMKTDNPSPSDVKNNPGQYGAVSQFTVGDNNVYECQLTFSTEQKVYPTLPLARNAPDFTASCSISTPEIIINPSFGPEAGGTVVTIVTNWTPQVYSVSAVYIGINLTAEIHNSSENTVLVKTPEIESEFLINQPLPIILEISPNSSNITTGKYFTFKKNPRIDDVRPRELSISGGTTLSISGYSLDSVAYPLVRAAVIITNGSTITYYNVSYGSCHQPTENGTKMVCTSPPVYIRQDFLQYLYDQANPNTNVYGRRKRDSSFDYAWQIEDRNALHSGQFSEVRSKRSDSINSVTTNQTYTVPNSQEQMVIYLGMVFDGSKRYENNSLLGSSGTFELKYPPNISCASDIQYADIVTIPGNGFTRCCTKEDYTIRIGDGPCNIHEITDNALTCTPPKSKPQQTDADKLYCGDNFVLIIELKYETWKCSCLKYPDGNSTKLIIIVVTTVGSTLVLIVVIAVILAIRRRKQKIKSSTHHRESKDDPRGGHRDMTSNYQPKNNIEGTTVNAGSAYYSSQIQTAYLELEPEAFGLSNQMSKEGSQYLRPN